MKNIFKKLTLAICAVSASVMLITAPALASSEGFRSGPDGETTVTDTTTTDNSSSGVAVSDEAENSGVEANDVTSAQTGTRTSNKHYQTRLGGFLWFLLSVIVNFILSCWIGSKFYNMARKNAQGSNEIRALRKDIEEKFASTIKEIDEPAVEVINRNENYSRGGEGVEIPDRKPHVELDEEAQEMMRRWDSRRPSTRAAEPEEDDDNDDEFEVRRSARRSYRPTRKSSGIEFEDDEDYEEERSVKRRPAKRSGKGEAISNAKNKAKDFLSNVFPFDE